MISCSGRPSVFAETRTSRTQVPAADRRGPVPGYTVGDLAQRHQDLVAVVVVLVASAR